MSTVEELDAECAAADAALEAANAKEAEARQAHETALAEAKAAQEAAVSTRQTVDDKAAAFVNDRKARARALVAQQAAYKAHDEAMRVADPSAVSVYEVVDSGDGDGSRMRRMTPEQIAKLQADVLVEQQEAAQKRAAEAEAATQARETELESTILRMVREGKLKAVEEVSP